MFEIFLIDKRISASSQWSANWSQCTWYICYW